MRKTVVFALVFLFFFSVILSAQELSGEEKKVWERIEQCLSFALRDQNFDAHLRCVHDDFVGWDPFDPIPRGKGKLMTIGRYLIESSRVVSYEARPLEVRIYGNLAFAHYLMTTLEEKEGTVETSITRWTDLMIKENDTWLWIGDHGSVVPPAR